ncbi:MAG: YihY/virulence factor BrkB family protein [Desulfurobacteriaceae bacterium]
MNCEELLKKIKQIKFLRYVLFAVCDAIRYDYLFFAASIAYFTLMSIIPLFIFLFFLGMIVFQINFYDFVPKEFINSPLNPIFTQIEQVINNSGLVSGTAALVMLWFSRGIFLSLERSFCEILCRKSSCNFIHKNLLVIAVIFFLWILMFIFYSAKYLIALLLPQLPLLSFVSSMLVPILLFAILLSIYYFLLPIEIPFKFILKTSIFVFFLLTIVEKVLVWFILNISKIGIFYGSFAALIVFLIWIYYSATVILLGVGIIKAKLILDKGLSHESGENY